ncbi:helix-turn-helix transcriptional regulator [Kitasatospora purpeofusca]|uniref:Helix-turn-helix transcriptional regulator n=1 Tax=Kitasatospora purpeofusca TaxID=67352 RepID=A0ABZ1TZD0_9ACTN|nr:helix-turn-helix transcriptional regulator [Kitasatospora purpeofusca]
MARRKKAVPPAAPHYELAHWLRALRAESGLTYRQMADRIARSGCSPATLSRADSGSALPRLGVVEAYAAACGASVREARQRWERAASGTGTAAARAERRPGAAPAGGRARRLELVYEPAHLLEAMHRLRLAAGQPSLRELQERARTGGFGALPRSTLADVLAGLRMPSEPLLVTYVRCCGIPGDRIAAWRAAWFRAVGSCGPTAVPAALPRVRSLPRHRTRYGGQEAAAAAASA